MSEDKKDKFQIGIEERAKFLAWLSKHVPKRYRDMTETDECFSAAVKDFQFLYAASEDPYLNFQEKRKSLLSLNAKLAEKWPHVFGNAEKPCERCLRVINAYALYQARHHPTIFTPSANELIALELRTRNIEHESENRGYKGDGLYLVQAKVPLMGGDPSLHETHLIFYDESTVRGGQQTLIERIRNICELRNFADFSEMKPFRFPNTKHPYFVSSSEEHAQRQKGYTRTVVDIVARNEYHSRIKSIRH